MSVIRRWYWEEIGAVMNRKEKEKRYEDYIERTSQAATAAGRRVPYHLEYLRRHGAGPVPERGRDGSTGQQDCRKRGT